MNRLLRGIALAAAGAAAMSLYRQWQRMPEGQRRRHHLETWENEGGALPEGALSVRRPGRHANPQPHDDHRVAARLTR